MDNLVSKLIQLYQDPVPFIPIADLGERLFPSLLDIVVRDPDRQLTSDVAALISIMSRYEGYWAALAVPSFLSAAQLLLKRDRDSGLHTSLIRTLTALLPSSLAAPFFCNFDLGLLVGMLKSANQRLAAEQWMGADKWENEIIRAEKLTSELLALEILRFFVAHSENELNPDIQEMLLDAAAGMAPQADCPVGHEIAELLLRLVVQPTFSIESFMSCPLRDFVRQSLQFYPYPLLQFWIQLLAKFPEKRESFEIPVAEILEFRLRDSPTMSGLVAYVILNLDIFGLIDFHEPAFEPLPAFLLTDLQDTVAGTRRLEVALLATMADRIPDEVFDCVAVDAVCREIALAIPSIGDDHILAAVIKGLIAMRRFVDAHGGDPAELIECAEAIREHIIEIEPTETELIDTFLRIFAQDSGATDGDAS
jgi:hypothetical protein